MKKGFALTMQYNERDLLPQWIAHYSKYFEQKNLYVIDHGSDVNYVPPGVNRIYVPRSSIFDEDLRRDCVKGIVFALMQYYDFGIFCDADELVVMESFDPEAMEPNQVYYTYGFDLFYVSIDGKRRIYGSLNPDECKPLVFNHALPLWSSGFHGCIIDHLPKIKPIMGHIKYIDREIYQSGLDQRREVYESMSDIHKMAGVAKHWVSGTNIDSICSKIQNAIDHGYVYKDLPDLSKYITHDYAGHTRFKTIDSPYLMDLTDYFLNLQ
jgi:hypothetical protein